MVGEDDVKLEEGNRVNALGHMTIITGISSSDIRVPDIRVEFAEQYQLHLYLGCGPWLRRHYEFFLFVCYELDQ